MNLYGKTNLEHSHFKRSIDLNNNNIINNNYILYPYDSFRPGIFQINNNKEGNKSSPDKYLTSKDFFKFNKGKHLTNEIEKSNFMDGKTKSKSLMKFNDIVQLFSFLLNLFVIYNFIQYIRKGKMKKLKNTNKT